jgi:hypothetical protein
MSESPGGVYFFKVEGGRQKAISNKQKAKRLRRKAISKKQKAKA